VTSGLFLFWDSKNYTPNGFWSDSSGNNRLAIMTGGLPTLSTCPHYLRFDGTNNGATAFTVTYNPSEFSIAAWFRTSSSGGHKIVGFESNQTGTGSSSYDRHLYVGTDGKLYFGIYNDVPFFGSRITINSSAIVNDYQYHYAVATYKPTILGFGDEMNLYLDGNLVASNTGTSNAEVAFGYWRVASYKLAGYPNGQDGYFNGDIGYVAIYDRLLSSSEVIDNYINGLGDISCTTPSPSPSPSPSESPTPTPTNTPSVTVNPLGGSPSPSPSPSPTPTPTLHRGRLYLWGKNNKGQLAQNDLYDTNYPKEVLGDTKEWVAIDAGREHFGAIKNDGTLWTWGRGDEGQIGDGLTNSKSSPVQIIGEKIYWRKVAMGRYHSAGIQQLIPSQSPTPTSTPTPTLSPTITASPTLTPTMSPTPSACGATPDRTASPTPTPSDTPTPTPTTTASPTPTASPFILMKTLWTWGENSYGALGDGTNSPKSSPVQTVARGINWSFVAAGYRFSAGIKSDGTLWIWGQNYDSTGLGGKLGDDTTLDKSSPVQTVAGGNDWKLVDLSDGGFQGGYHAAAIKNDGSLWLWGNNRYGQHGDNLFYNFKSSPVQTVTYSTDWSKVSCGGFFTAAIKKDSTLWVWGYNAYGQLGLNNIINLSSPVQTRLAGTTWSEVSCGNVHMAAIRSDNSLWLNGLNFFGQLGDGTRIARSSPTQTVVGGYLWSKIASGYNHTAAIKTDGSLWLWGQNSSGQLGDGTTIHRSSPVQIIGGGNNWAQISCGAQQTAAIKNDGSLWCWGIALGNNLSSSSSSPVQTIIYQKGWYQVSCGYNHNVALFDNSIIPSSTPIPTASPTPSPTLSLTPSPTPSGSASPTPTVSPTGPTPSPTITPTASPTPSACGATPDPTASPTPTPSSSQSPTPTISASPSPTPTQTPSPTFGSGALFNWGYNTFGQLGDNTKLHRSSPIQTVALGDTWAKIDVQMAIKDDGTLWVWGDNTNGRLGDNTTIHRSSPIQTMVGGNNWVSITSFGGAIKSDGSMWLWGDNTFGQLGDNTTTHRSSPIQTYADANTWLQISRGLKTTGAIRSDNTLWLWGSNDYGLLTSDTLVSASSPVEVIIGGSDWKFVSVGSNRVAAIKTDDSLWLWGDNYGQSLGTSADPLLLTLYSPTQVLTSGSWSVVSNRDNNTAAIKSDGTLWLWGWYLDGQIASAAPSTGIVNSPVQIMPGTNTWSKVDAAGVNTAAIKSNGSLWVWGNNENGQIGINNVIGFIGSPQQVPAPGNNWKDVKVGVINDLNSVIALRGQDPTATPSPSASPSPTPTPSYSLSPTPSPSVTLSATPTPSPTLSSSPTPTASPSASPTPSPTATISVGGFLLWGRNNNGQLGLNNIINVSTPTQISNDTYNWIQIDAGYSSFGAIKYDGTLWVWGDNTFGQLAQNNILPQSIPVQVGGITYWFNISAGRSAFAGIENSFLYPTPTPTPTATPFVGAGGFLMWGLNAFGQLGNNTTNNTSSPVQVFDDAYTWYAIDAGYDTFAGVKSDGTLWLWGANTLGQLGLDSTTNTSTPVQNIGSGSWFAVSMGKYVGAALNIPAPTGTPTPTPSGTGATPTPTMSPTPTPSPSPCGATPLITSTQTPTPSSSAIGATPTPTRSLTPTPSPVPSGTTPTPTQSGTPMPSITPTATPFNPPSNPIIPNLPTATSSPFAIAIPYPGFKSWSCQPVNDDFCCAYVGDGSGEYDDLTSCQAGCADTGCEFYNPPLCAGVCTWYNIVAGTVLVEDNCISGCGCQIPDLGSMQLGIQYILTGCLTTNI
jgi:alpha-tubulin suppressor-like RCC1 family protein